MSYTVFARKYRPQTFDEVVGQEHITTTLINAIDDGKVGHAYLFCGPRGVGKTSMARIFAKALNCKKGPTPTPCCRCEQCLAIAEGTDVDVVEFDAASNRQVEDARDLRQGVQYAPLRSRFKIYIMDESHMLTMEAFNTLLKTLEEPPPHIKFIFATTAPGKMPNTIASRCQRFDFHRATSANIVKRLKQICAREKLNITDQALAAVARVAGGAMRDSQSLLDQLIAFKGEEFGPDDVRTLMGTASPETCYTFFRHARNGAARETLELIDKIYTDGIDPPALLDQLTGVVRNLLVAKTCPENDNLLDLPDDELRLCRGEAAPFTVEHLLYAMQIVLEARRRVREGIETRVAIEVAALKLCRTPDVAGVNELLDRIQKLEANGPSSARAVPPPPPAPRSTAVKASSPIPPAREATAAPTAPSAPSPTVDAATTPVLLKMVQHLKDKGKISLSGVIKDGRMIDLPDGGLEIRFPHNYIFHKTQVEQPANRREIEESLAAVTGKRPTMRFTLDGAAHAAPAPEPEDEEVDKPPQKGYNDAAGHPTVRKILETFDGKIISVEGSS